MHPLRRQRGFMKAREDELQLAGIAVDVADGEDAGRRGLEGFGADADQVLVEIEAPFGHWPKLHRQAEEGQHRIAGDVENAAVIALHRRGGKVWRLALQARDLAELQRDLAFSHHGPHPFDGMRRGAELVATVQQGQAPGDGAEVQRPVKRRIAAADDQHITPLEQLHPADGVEDAGAFIGIDIGDWRLLGLEGAAARRHDHHFCLEDIAGIGRDAEFRRLRRSDLDHALHLLVEVELRAERLDLLQQVVDEALPGHHREAGNVIDRLFRVKLCALPSDLRQDVDKVAFDIEQAQFENSEKAAGSRADDQGVGFDDAGLTHGLSAFRLSLIGETIGPVFRGVHRRKARRCTFDVEGLARYGNNV